MLPQVELHILLMCSTTMLTSFVHTLQALKVKCVRASYSDFHLYLETPLQTAGKKVQRYLEDGSFVNALDYGSQLGLTCSPRIRRQVKSAMRVSRFVRLAGDEDDNVVVQEMD
jgi:hypothetical protein